MSYNNGKPNKSLGLIRRTLHHCKIGSAKKHLYLCMPPKSVIAILRKTLSYWRSSNNSSEFILGDFSSYYKYCLVCLKILPPLVIVLELNDIIYVVKFLENQFEHFNIFNYISMPTITTRCSGHLKNQHVHAHAISVIPPLLNTIIQEGFTLTKNIYKATRSQLHALATHTPILGLKAPRS